MVASDPRVAWIESPLQLLGAVELSAADGAPLKLVPRVGVPQLAETIAAITDALPDTVRVAPAAASATAGDFATARHRVIGDVFSGQFRALVARRGVRRLTIVDDGSLTLHLAAALLDGPFARMAQREGAAMRALGAAARRRILSAARRGDVDLFTVYAATPQVARLAAAGVAVRANRFEWLRSASPPGVPELSEPTVVLGSAIVTDRQVAATDYLAWVAELAARTPIAYLPHRRETPHQREAVAAIPGARVHDAGLPAELVLGSAAALERVITFPSSAVATLGAVLPASARIDVRTVPDAWWLPGADPALRAAFGAIGAARPDGTQAPNQSDREDPQ